ncbi:MAG: hypothetical protein IPI43_10275 [Sandaracinaceae bacterium]|nr:hypothetical protein [Sandaracinaceae bacterium]
MTRLIERWPTVRAALLTLVIVHAVLFGVQIPDLDEERLEGDYWQPLVQRVQSLTDDTQAESRARIARHSAQLISLRAQVTWPLAWIYRGLRAGQTWNMFEGAEKQNFALHVEMRRAGRDEFETLYTVHDPDARFEAERIEYRRVHAAYIAFDNGTPGPYYAFCRWVAKRVFYTYDDAVEVRVRMKRLDYRDYAERVAHPERSGWANGIRITREQFQEDMQAPRD